MALGCTFTSKINKAVVDIRLRPGDAPREPLCVHAVLASPLPGGLWANMTSCTEPEVHCVVVRGGRRHDRS